MTLPIWRQLVAELREKGDDQRLTALGGLTTDHAHRAQVERALNEGEPVPMEVVRDYPDLFANVEVWRIPFPLWKEAVQVLREQGNTACLRKLGGMATDRAHRVRVERALQEGKPVPVEVLKDYPDVRRQLDFRFGDN